MNKQLEYNQEISLKEKEILKQVYENIFKSFSNTHVDIFLCGGKLDLDTTRRKITKEFEKFSHIKVFYPEVVFAEYFNLNKNADYLTLENILGDQVDFICIVCESWGAVTELGAFSNHKDLSKKVIAINNIEHEDGDSFITLGPIKFLKKQNSDSVKYYENDKVDELCKVLNSQFKKHLKTAQTFRDVDKITGMFYFVSLILYFFKSVSKITLDNYLKYIIFELLQKDKTFKFNAMFLAAKKLLFKDEFIEKSGDNFALTPKGEYFIEELLNKNENDIYNQIISDIIDFRYYP